jgi:hypothetical protein
VQPRPATQRRSELVGPDWRKLGAGTGFVCVDERGIVATLMASKASQNQTETIDVPFQNNTRHNPRWSPDISARPTSARNHGSTIGVSITGGDSADQSTASYMLKP